MAATILIEEQPRKFQDAPPGHFVISKNGVIQEDEGILVKLCAPISGYNVVDFLGEIQVIDLNQEVRVVSFRFVHSTW